MAKRCAIVFAVLIFLASASDLRAALGPDQIALIANAQVPESVQLAHFYAKARGVPEDRIIELNLPVGDEIIFDSYEQFITPQIRKWLRDHKLENQIKCLVTMYGVPLRIGDRFNSPRDTNERAQLVALYNQLIARLNQVVADAEAKAAGVDSTFKADTSGGNERLIKRLADAANLLERHAAAGADASVRPAAISAVQALNAELGGPIVVDSPLIAPATAPATAPSKDETSALIERPFDADARAKLRATVRRSMGLLALTKIVHDQAEYLTTDATSAAFDNELALLWWPTYSRSRWQLNPLNAGYHGPMQFPMMMTMRLDAPTPQLVRNLIADSVEVERAGLKGKFVVDTRGLPAVDAAGKPDAYGAFDERLRKLADVLRPKISLPLVVDDKPAVLPPGSVDDVALYLGWYSVRNYVPGMKFNRGAVGFHVASFELVDLHNPREAGWARGLITDGVVGTVGPVAEPYLHSFPEPEEFFPLLLTGKLTLAEVYWASTPLTSWMQTCIGDPLYKPFAKQPALAAGDLSQELQTFIQAR